jgi:predicted RNase H-like HicB family nuclease
MTELANNALNLPACPVTALAWQGPRQSVASGYRDRWPVQGRGSQVDAESVGFSLPHHTGLAMEFTIEIEQDEDGRWIAEIIELPGVMTYGPNPDDARAKVQELALRGVAEQLEHGEAAPDLLSISFNAA